MSLGVCWFRIRLYRADTIERRDMGLYEVLLSMSLLGFEMRLC